jgi:hypothetical protein
MTPKLDYFFKQEHCRPLPGFDNQAENLDEKAVFQSGQ